MKILGRLRNDLNWNYGIGIGRRPDLLEAYPLIAVWCFKLTKRAEEGEVGVMKKNSKGFYIRITLLGIKIDRRV